ncbi:VOC family protein [Kitasatospora phosalacinea]|uniref:Hydroxylase n=1 Tax=Kitasatospora phosalacinea TaxID=2065 RepID=A0A9W6PR99_9ACTN|nr:VOC family protein [Kitasatospora phosalacinea]GLW59539.1 hydroxylase [Kitasatospora phosalacinea]
MITTDFVPGSPCWLDLGAPDVSAAAAFYGPVLGWEFEPPEGSGDPDGAKASGSSHRSDGFLLAVRGGRTAGGIGLLTERGARSAWMPYFFTPDVHETAASVLRAGGSVRVGPRDVAGWASMAQFTDPQGGQFAVWTPGRSGGGLAAVDDPGGLCWTELYTTDAAGALAFYETVFGWQREDTPMPGGRTYTIVTPAGQPPERMHGGVLEVGTAELALSRGVPAWHPVFAVADCDAATAAVRDGGGAVAMGPEDAPGIGRMSVCVDPSGADFVLMTPAAPGPAAT